MSYLSLTLPGNQTINPPSSLGPKGGIDAVGRLFSNGFALMLIICVVLSLIFIVVAGIQWVLSGGDKTKLQAARSKLTWAVVGLIIAFVAFFIISVLGYVFQVNLLNFG